MDRISRAARSRNMSAIRSTKNKSTEIRMISVFRTQNIIGWRRGSKIFGKPDFVLPSKKTAVFVDGCFWHGCKKCKTMPKQNRIFWSGKIARNIQRDKKVTRRLRIEGWTVIRIWEHQLTPSVQPVTLRKIIYLTSSVKKAKKEGIKST